MIPMPYSLPLACPVCGRRLKRAGGAFRCAAAHSFDLAREGYVNLLPARRAVPATVGDAPEMLAARRGFLEAGHYAPLARTLARIVDREAARANRPLHLLDAGCGEGYYLGAVQAAIEGAGSGRPLCFGTDVARSAVRLAARRYPAALFAVADTTTRLPFIEGSVDVLLNLFAPRNPAEFARVLAPAGLLVIVLPAPDHLLSLRQSLPLLGIEENKIAHVRQQFTGSFQPAGTEELRFDLVLDGAMLRQLVTMMPGYRRPAAPDRARLATLEGAHTQAAFMILSFRREPATSSRMEETGAVRPVLRGDLPHVSGRTVRKE